MRHHLALLSLVAVLALTAAIAYAAANVGMRITVPFDFYAGDQILPAGEYAFAMESGLAATGSQVTIQAKDGKGICILLARPDTDEAASRLLFAKYGDKHFLSSVSIQGFQAAVKTTKLERELQAQLQKQPNVILFAQK